MVFKRSMCLDDSLRINHEGFLYELYGTLRDPVEQFPGEGQLALSDVQVRFLLRVSSERGVPAEKYIGQDAHRPDVRRQR